MWIWTLPLNVRNRSTQLTKQHPPHPPNYISSVKVKPYSPPVWTSTSRLCYISWIVVIRSKSVAISQHLSSYSSSLTWKTKFVPVTPLWWLPVHFRMRPVFNCLIFLKSFNHMAPYLSQCLQRQSTDGHKPASFVHSQIRKQNWSWQILVFIPHPTICRTVPFLDL